MSVWTELEELVKWISELSAKDKPQSTPEPLPREDWQAIHRDLDRAPKKLAEARVKLLTNDWPSFLAEFAGDLEHEADDLALRARLLSRRAQPKPKTAEEKKAEEKKAEEKKAEEKTAEEKKAEEKKAEEESGEPPSKQSVFDLLESALGTMETAHEKLGSDAVSKTFEGELDVLAEMTLSLHQRCERLEPEGEKAVREAAEREKAERKKALREAAEREKAERKKAEGEDEKMKP